MKKMKKNPEQIREMVREMDNELNKLKDVIRKKVQEILDHCIKNEVPTEMAVVGLLEAVQHVYMEQARHGIERTINKEDKDAIDSLVMDVSKDKNPKDVRTLSYIG